MKVYGLTKLQKAYVDVLQRFEREIARGVKYTPDGKVSLAFASPADIYSQYCGCSAWSARIRNRRRCSSTG
jgi:hypothetical protein